MKGSKKVLTELNKLLALELAAIDQYFIHARMYEDWGLEKLFERINHESEDERMHASLLIGRILFLEGIPDMSTRTGLNIGKDVPDMLESDLQLEYADAKALKDSIKICEAEKDYQTREILEKLLEDTEEDHAYWLEQQLGLIKKIGLPNYLQSQM
ncbi:MAG: bacterioferritin [Pseudomonadales bacterium]